MTDSHQPNRRPSGQPLDVIGVGFGPANLALAIALEEGAGQAGAATSCRFLERQPRFGWHRGMLIDDATMQVSFLKDLATMRNPTSSFSFVSYLHERGRLADFINYKSFFPLRVEFHDYLEWAAARLSHLVSYDDEVSGIEPLIDRDGVISGFEVHSRSGTRRASNVVVAAGLEPRLPDGISGGERVWHSSQLLHRLDGLGDGFSPDRLVVIGAGQSGAEVTAMLHDRFPAAEIHAVVSRFGYAPADDSPFANRIFDPAAVELYADAPAAIKQMLLDDHRNTNYAVVDQELIVELYRRSYRESVTGRQRLNVHNLSRVVELSERPDTGEVRLSFEHRPTGAVTTIDADLVVLATGYRPADPLRLLGPAAALCGRDGDGQILIDRDCRVALDMPSRASLFVQGAAEHVHGIGSTLLSMVAVRAGWISDALTVGATTSEGDGQGADPACYPAVESIQ